LLIASGLGFGFVYAAAEPEAAMGSVRSLLGPVAGCDIKGNVSISSGERIHGPRGFAIQQRFPTPACRKPPRLCVS